jgi:hypothetical protein
MFPQILRAREIIASEKKKMKDTNLTMKLIDGLKATY